MKTGKTLSEMAAELERQVSAKRDFLVDTKACEVVKADEDPKRFKIAFGDNLMPIQEHAHNQIGERLQIPAKYYDKMRDEAPDLFVNSVNTWMRKNPEKRLIRSLDGEARAFLSDRYQRIDNYDVANTVLPILSEIPGLQVKSAEITISRMYIKVVSTETRTEIKSRRVGDFVESGVLISNSEIGLGALQIQPFFYFLACTNGMVRNKAGMRAYHVSKRNQLEADEVFAMLSDDTKRLEDKATLARMRDILSASMDRVKFQEAVAKMQSTTQEMITGSPEKAIDKTVEVLRLTETEKSSVFRHLIEGGDLSQYGLMNAVTRTAEDASSYDRATEIEAMGGLILDLPQKDWQLIATAA